MWLLHLLVGAGHYRICCTQKYTVHSNNQILHPSCHCVFLFPSLLLFIIHPHCYLSVLWGLLIYKLYLLAVTDEDTVKRYYAKFEEKFFQTCEKELAKINTFYSGNDNKQCRCATYFHSQNNRNHSVVSAHCPAEALHLWAHLSPPLPSRKASRGSAAIRHAAEWAAVIFGCPERELGQRAGPKEEEDGVRPVTAGAMQTQKHKGPAAGLLRVLPQPHTVAELSGRCTQKSC